MRVGGPPNIEPEKVLDNAMHAFWARGYDACSVKDLMEITGLSKGSLYGYFGDKRSLFDSCLIRYRIRTTQWLFDSLDDSDSTMEFVEKALNRVVVEAGKDSPQGCFVMNTASEFGQLNPQVAAIVSESLDQFTDVFRTGFIRGQVTGEIPNEIPAAELAAYVVSSMAGLRTMVKSGMNKPSVENTIAIILRGLR